MQRMKLIVLVWAAMGKPRLELLLRFVFGTQIKCILVFEIVIGIGPFRNTSPKMENVENPSQLT